MKARRGPTGDPHETGTPQDRRPIMTIRRLFPLLAVAVGAVASSPAVVAGQISSCWLCEESPSQPDNESEICVGWYWGKHDCAQIGSPDFHICDPYGGWCWDGLLAAADEVAVESVRVGELLSAEGDHLVLTEGDDIVVMRKCGAEIARFAMSELKSSDDRAGPLAIGPTGSKYPDTRVGAIDRRPGILEE